MGMKIAIHQPDYLSYLGYFYKVSQADRFVFLDDCQFSCDNWHHWNRIKTPQGECRLKVPVDYSFGDAIHVVRTRDELGWKAKHLKTIQMNYRKAAFFEEIFPPFEALLLKDYPSLAEMNIAIMTWIFQGFGFKQEIFRSSELPIQSVSEERVLDICTLLGGETYISGHGADAYQSREHFEARGIDLVYSEFHPFEYPQCWMKQGFIPYLSVMDYLLNCGFDWERVGRAGGLRCKKV